MFGVNPKVFSGVDQRPGLIEQAQKGALFLDEVHNLPVRVQRSLLRVIEHGQTSRIGETASKPADVRFIFASNAGGETMGLAHDLFARLRVVRVPALTERVADVPSIFEAVLRNALKRKQLNDDEVTALVSGDHYEAMCLDRFEKDNVRGLIDLADRIASSISGGADPEQTLMSIFAERFEDSPVIERQADKSKPGAVHYEANREMIIKAYQSCGENVSALERMLKSKGMRCSRRWLVVYLEKWGIK